MIDAPENRYCPGCGRDVSEIKTRFCPKCASRIEFASKLSPHFEPQNAGLMATLRTFLDRIAQDSLMAMVAAIARNEPHAATIENGVYQNQNSILTLINEELKWVLEISSKPEGENS